MRRFLAMISVTALLAASLCGCSQGSGEEKNTDTSAESKVQESTGTQTDDASKEEPYVCKIVCVGDATSEACEAVAEAASEITMEKFNVKIELVRLGYGTFVEEVNLMLSSGEKLDLYPSFGYTTMTAVNMGQILDITDLLNEYGQGILDTVAEGEWACTTFNGRIYAVPNNKEKAQGYGIALRTDMLEAVGYDISQIKTEEDLTELFKVVREKYPDVYPVVADNGQIAYNMTLRDDLGGDFGVLMDCTNTTDMTVVDYYATDAYKDIVTRHYAWAQEGYMMPDADTSTENAYDIIGNGKGFSAFTNTKPGIEAEWARKTGCDMTVIELVPPFKTTSGVSNQWYIAAQSEQPEKAMQVLNEIYTNSELSNLLINGIEGINYVVNGDVLTYPEGVDASNTSYSSVAWVWPNELNSTPWEADGADIWTETEAFNESAVDSLALGFVWDNANVLNEITACNNVTAKYANALICGSVDPDEALPKMLSELESAGVQTILDEKQNQLDKWMEQK